MPKPNRPPPVHVEKCSACKSGASGKDGHAHLVERFRSNIGDLALPQFATFQCTSCGVLWRRLGSADRCDWSAERR
jgi:hypothetical protein